MTAAIARNVYGLEGEEGAARAMRLTRYAFAVEAALGEVSLETFQSGSAPFPAPEATE